MSTTPTPAEEYTRAQAAHGYGDICLRREGDDAIVEIRVGGHCIPVCRQSLDSNFYECVTPLGIEDAIAGHFAERQSLFEFTSFVNWNRQAQKYFAGSGHASADTICIDNAGHIISGGLGFTLADRNGWYPVKVYSTREEPDSAPSPGGDVR